MTIYMNAISYNTPEHDEAVRLRRHILYTPYSELFDDERKTLDADKTIYGLYDDELIGALVTEPTEEGLHIDEILVDYNKRRQGLGNQMLKFLEARMEKGRVLSASGPLSARGFFERNGFEVKSKHNGPNDRMRIDYEKKIGKKAHNPIPLYDKVQEQPLVLFTASTLGFELIPVIRNHFSKEHLIVVDLLKDDNYWFEVAKRVKAETAKYAMIAPELYSNRNYRPLADFDMARAGAIESDRASKTKTVLILGTEDEFASNDYRAAFEAQNPSLSAVEMTIDSDLLRAAHTPSAAFYDVLSSHMAELKEKNFDTILVIDSKLSSQSDAIEKFFEEQLMRQLQCVDIFDLVVSALRRELVEQNLLRHEASKGKLTIFSETPNRAREALMLHHPAERSAEIQTIR
ncbi:MAG: GNAT family N-acetyltransferase [Peptoniphilus sp.]|nr:GNAT family N-acetyltransferase [Peptoniphilus sp.]MDD7363798.1 GNAT family N-acetyltransferase [Bacillota bacterium]MDY6044639.1 GNAT family N-acetyltransferase [Peptoniphilus sp.]